MNASKFVVGFALMFPTSTFSATIIDSATFGFYNAGLGDLAADGTLGVQTDIATGFNLFPAANIAAGDPLIPPVATQPSLAAADPLTQANLGNFLLNTTALGGTWSASAQAIPSGWAVNTETAIVYEFSAGSGLANVHIDLGVDNGIFVWLDGGYLFGALSPGTANINEYDIAIGNLSAGTHFLQVLREDHGGATGYDIVLSGDFADVQPIPEPSTLLLIGSALGVVAYRRRRLL